MKYLYTSKLYLTITENRQHLKSNGNTIKKKQEDREKKIFRTYSVDELMA